MIIQCEQCETTYRFDPTRLRNAAPNAQEGQVRCIRCGHIFTIGAESDLGENFLNLEPAAAAATPPSAVPFSAPLQAETLAESPHEILGTPDHEPAEDYSFAEEKTTDAPHNLAADTSSTEDFHFTAPSEFSLASDFPQDISDPDPESVPAPALNSIPPANEFVFEPLQAQSHESEVVPTEEDGEEIQDQPAASAPAAVVRKAQKKKTSKLLLLALLLILIFAGVYTYYFVVHGISNITQVISTMKDQGTRIINPHTEPSGSSIQIQLKDNFYISNTHLGSIFIINGTVTNTSAQPQGEIAVIASLHSTDGTTLRSIKVYCGNPISKETLRSEPLDILQKFMDNKLGTELSNVSVQPGESIPFCAVFHNLPEKFTEFDVNAVPLANMGKQ
ncbi:MAG: DUF3426 domain-containing protein [Desulfuromonadaceae bacterium]|nr:DUF3426 domain-containing protein [Desulfuromonas sp.]MDY0186066.1 DUF3426 domain-containing protein [Desulfuromonadaceae bacterium]